MKFRHFDHLSFAILCILVVLHVSAGRPVDELVFLVMMGMSWTLYHTYNSSKDPDFKIGDTEKLIAISLYTLAALGTPFALARHF